MPKRLSTEEFKTQYPQIWAKFKEQSKLGDPDWIFDILGELERPITPTDTFYLADIHGPLQKNDHLYNARSVYNAIEREIGNKKR